MYYRRKIVLALIETFGGSLTTSDCRNLLILFCHQSKHNYYDFFPGQYGNVSIILDQDKQRLTELGYLVDTTQFQLCADKAREESYQNQLKAFDRILLTNFAIMIGNTRGQDLLYKTYQVAPHLTSRGKITSHILSDGEYYDQNKIESTSSRPELFTIGYEGLSIDAYLDILLAHNIYTLVDVRKNPLSMKYGFSKSKLASYTQITGIKYIHISDLGIPSKLRKNLQTEQDYQALFQYYYTAILPEHIEALKQLKQIIHTDRRVAITCFEANHHFCHRHKVAEYLINDPDFNTPITHIEERASI